jgi:hypothetical protein
VKWGSSNIKFCAAAFTLMTILGWSAAGAAEKETVIEVDGVRGVAAHMKKIGFYDIDNNPERLQAVPRMRIFACQRR